MSPTEGQEEYEETQAELKKYEDDVRKLYCLFLTAAWRTLTVSFVRVILYTSYCIPSNPRPLVSARPIVAATIFLVGVGL